MGELLTSKQRLELRKAHRLEKYQRFADRIKVILALDSGWSTKDIAEMLLIDPDTVRRYQKKFHSEGLEGLCSFSYEGRRSELSAEEQKKLVKELRSKIYLSTQEVVAYIENTFGVSYSTSGVTALLHRLGFSYKKPSLVPGKANAEAQQEFLNKLDELKRLKSPKTKLYYGDGTHPQHNSMPSYGWLPKGESTPLKSNTGRKRVNLSGVLDAETHEVIVKEEFRLNADSTIAFFRLIERRNPKCKNIYIILDNAGYYKGDKIRKYLENSRIEIIFLPPYAPNLNLIERLWKFFKKMVLYNRYYETFEEFRNACLTFFTKKNMRRHRKELDSLLTDNFQIVSA